MFITQCNNFKHSQSWKSWKY